MRVAMRAGAPAFILSILTASFLYAQVLPAPDPFPGLSSLVWGGNSDNPGYITILDGGVYSVPLGILAPAYVTGPLHGPDGITTLMHVGELYKIDENGVREYVHTFHTHQPSNPENPNGDPLFAWETAGSYELDISGIPLPILNFEDKLRRWIARVLFADIAHAQFGVPIPYGTVHFTIEDAAPSTPEPVIIIPGILGSEQHNGVWEIDPILHTYDDLIATLDINGYTPDVDLFPFPYNWRESNVETAVLLKQKIDEVKNICSCDKVDLVAHSMGGLVARQYIQSDAYEDDVDQLIFLGTPHLGAPKAYLMWEGGETDPKGLSNYVLQKILDQEALEKGYPDLFSYIQNEPVVSVRELLPVYSYIFDGVQLRSYPNNYPANLFLENLNVNFGNFSNMAVKVHNFVGSIADLDTITAITTEGNQNYLPKWGHGYPAGFYEGTGNRGMERGSGDSTVPLPSASFVQSNLEVSSFSHNFLPDGFKTNVYSLLMGKEAAVVVDNINFPNLKLILIKILSPADLFIIAPDGKKIGRDLDGQEVNEILNAFYTGFNTDTEFITILNPLPGEYKVYTQGTGEGQYTVETTYIVEEGTTEASFSGNTTPDLTTELKLSLDTENPESLDIAPTDTEPPVTSIAQPESRDYLRSEELPVDVSAEDIDSGVFALETFFDDVSVPNSGTVDLFFQSLGEHTILASSTDNVGNATTSARNVRVVATPDSTLADFERVHTEGWMNGLTYLVLKPQLNVYLRFAKQLPPIIFKRSLAPVILKQLERYRGKGLSEEGYLILKEDIEWLITNGV